MRLKILGILLILLAIVGGYTLLLASLHWYLPEEVRPNDLPAFVQSAVAVVAVVFAGIYAIAKWELFRDFEPHLNVSHLVRHRNIGESYVHLDVTVTLHNSSKVQVGLRRGFLVLQSISPAMDGGIEEIYQEAFAGEYVEDFGWPVLEEEVREWERGELVIEPGEVHREVLEFIISRETHTVQVYTFYYNPKSDKESAGWSMATVYDIIE